MDQDTFPSCPNRDQWPVDTDGHASPSGPVGGAHTEDLCPLTVPVLGIAAAGDAALERPRPTAAAWPC